MIDLFYATVGLPENVVEAPSRSRGAGVMVKAWRAEDPTDPNNWAKFWFDPADRDELVPPPATRRNVTR